MKELPNTITLPRGQLFDQQKWCEENIGARWGPISDRCGVWTVLWSGYQNDTRYYTWYFKNEKDAALFALRWS